MVLSPNVKPTYTLIPSRISWHSTPCSTHSLFALPTSSILKHVVWATNSGYTGPLARILAPGAQNVPNHVPTLNQLPATPFYLLNSQVLALIFLFATIPATPQLSSIR